MSFAGCFYCCGGLEKHLAMIFQLKLNIWHDPAIPVGFYGMFPIVIRGTHMGIKEVLVSESVLENL